jgi:uncharacterized LabA/DUF88 family protein
VRPALRAILFSQRPQDDSEISEAHVSGIRIFADYWNIERRLSENYGFSPQLRWATFGNHISSQISAHLGRKVPLRFDGLHVYASFSTSEDDLARKAALENALAVGPGSSLLSEERGAKRSRIKCLKCGELVSTEKEKSVDVRLAVDVIKAAAVPDTEIIALASADEDFLPLLEYVRFVGKKLFLVELPNTTKKMKDLAWGTLGWGNTEGMIMRSVAAGPGLIWDSRVSYEDGILATIEKSGANFKVRDVSVAPLNGKEVRAIMRVNGWPFVETSEGRNGSDFPALAKEGLQLKHPLVLADNVYSANNLERLRELVAIALQRCVGASRSTNDGCGA